MLLHIMSTATASTKQNKCELLPQSYILTNSIIRVTTQNLIVENSPLN